MKHKWFYNFDGLRFFAALLVVITHSESLKKDFNLPSLYQTSFFTNAGPIAVTFFFVLSGFLIAWLLMQEQLLQATEKRKIRLQAFYTKRILRIWPLYYTVVLLTFFVFPHIALLQYPGFGKSFLTENFNAFELYVSFLPNLSYHEYGNVLYLGQVWSLGVEEFFYLFFPLGLYFLSPGNNLKFFIVLAAGSIAITVASKFWCSINDINLPLPCIYISRYRIYAFASGALSAYGYMHLHNKHIIYKNMQLVKIITQALLIVTAAVLLSGITFSSLTHPVYAFVFAVLLLLLTVSNTKIASLNHRYIIYLGKISYGIYMLHPLAIIICIKLFYFNSGIAVLDVILFDTLAVTVVIVLAMISYTCLEKPFLKLRKTAVIK